MLAAAIIKRLNRDINVHPNRCTNKEHLNMYTSPCQANSLRTRTMKWVFAGCTRLMGWGYGRTHTALPPELGVLMGPCIWIIHQKGMWVIVEGYAATVCPYQSSRCSTSQLKGSFSLRAWELGIVGDKTIMKTAKLDKLDYVSTWQCLSAIVDHHFDVTNCNASCSIAPKVHWLGLWSQYTDDNEKQFNGDCFVVGENGQKSNVL